MTTKSTPINVEPNRYVDGRSWGDSKTHLGLRTPADGVAGPLRLRCPWRLGGMHATSLGVG
jgi:hypothetical protein